MRLSLTKIVLAIFFLPVLAATQTSAPGKSPRSNAPAASSPQSAAPSVIARPSPTPAPPTPNPALASAPVLTGPQYSPMQLDFGALWDGDSAKKTFSLVTPAAGMVTLAFPGGGNFWLTEFRELAPIQGPSKNNPAGHFGGLGTGGVKSRTTYPPGIPVSPYLQWNLAAGSEVQFDIVFKPVYQPDGPNGGTNPTGLKSIMMKLSGPGPITPWSVSIPVRGTFNGPKKLDLSPQPPISGSQNSGTQGAVGSMSAQVPSPTSEVLPTSKVSKSDKLSAPAQVPSSTSQVLPTAKVSKSDKLSAPAQPPPAPLPPSSAFVDNTPQHSPDQFDFGEVWDGDFAKKTLSLTTNAAGYVTIQIPKGPFRVAAFRELGAVQLPSKNQGKQGANIGPFQPMKSKITYLDGQPGPFQWSMAPGVDIQIDIAFQPHFNLFTETAGQKSTTMKVTGPGPKGNWAISIPLRGMFDGLRVTAPIVPEIKELYAVGGDSKTSLNVSIAGLGTPVEGTLKGGQNLPQGVAIVPKSVKVPAGQSIKTSVELSLNQFSVDGVPRPLDLVFETAKGSSKAQLQFIGVSAYGFEVNSGDRGDCGVSRISLSLSISGPQPAQDGSRTVRVIWVNKGWNYDLIKKHYVWMVAESGGVRIFDRTLVLYNNQPDEVFENSAIDGAPGSLKVSAEQWAQILKGPFRFGCQELENSGKPNPENPKWGPAFKGSKI